MLGSAMLRVLADSPELDVHATARSASVRQHFSPALGDKIIPGIDVENPDSLSRVLSEIKPQAVINCVGLVKQLAEANDPLAALPINALLPHRLARLCALGGARLIHISTDCVFAGTRGNYLESDPSDAYDLYGKSKFLGEVGYAHTITLRTSIIGHEIGCAHGLIGWFMGQQKQVKGYTKAVFSGLPTVELASVVKDIILNHPDLFGLYHVASEPISKFDLLTLVAEIYGKKIEMVRDESVVIDRSLNGDLFKAATGYMVPDWPELVKRMYEFK